MAYIDALTEQEVTLRDFKSVLNRLMTNIQSKETGYDYHRRRR